MSKICFITVRPVSAQLFLRPHMKNLAAAGHEVHLVTSQPTDFRDIDDGHWIVHRIALPAGISPILDAKAVWALLAHFRSQDYDLVNAHMFKAGFLAMIAGVLARQPHRVYHNHGMLFLARNGLTRLLLKSAERLTCALAHRVYYVSFSNRQDAIDEGVTSRDKSRVLGCGSIRGLEAAEYEPTRQRRIRGRQLRSTLGIPDSAFVVGYVGRAVEHKGYHLTINCWVRHFKEDPRFCLLLVGSTSDALRQAARSELENVRVVSWTDQLANYYQAMDLVILPSLHEGLGYTLLEGNAAGLPVIGSRISGIVDAIEDEVNGLLVAPGDIDDLAQAIRRLHLDAALRAQLGREGSKRVRRKYDPSSVEAAFLAEFESLLSHPA